MTKEDLCLLLDIFYTQSHVPLYLLDEAGAIKAQSTDFITVDKTFFQSIMFKENNEYHFRISFLKNEIYLIYYLEEEHQPYTYLCAGPYLVYTKRRDMNLRELVFFANQAISEPQQVLKKLPRLDQTFFGQLQLIYGLLFHKKLTNEDFHQYLRKPHELKYSDTLKHLLHENREDATKTYTYQDELSLLHSIKQGDSLSARMYAIKLSSGRIGKMSEDQTRKTKYAIISSIAVITRAVIEVDVNIELAYALSDVYIRKVDEEYDNRKLMDLYLNVVWDFCELVRHHRYAIYPTWIRSMMVYISQHLYEEIRLDDLAELVHMAPAYVSVQFKKITKESLASYINKARIEEAKYLLETTDQSIQDIAYALTFSTQSYFAKVFQQVCGVLPSSYRTQHQTK